MNNNIMKERLLILGGITHMLDVVTHANQKGIYTIVCDYDPCSPAKRIAHKAYDVSTTDIEKLREIALKENVSGVFAGFEDLNTWNALRLCEQLKIPFYASESQLFITSNKHQFHEACKKNNIPVVNEHVYQSGDTLLPERMEFPIIVKPVDSYASRGISIIDNFESLRIALEKACAFSKTNSAVIEHFFEGYGIEAYYTVVNGSVALSAVADRYVLNQGGHVPPLPTGTIFPSRHLKVFLEKYDEKYKVFIRSLGIKNGLVLFQTVKDKENIYVYEMAYRLTGEQHYQIVKKECNIDLLDFMIDLSLGHDLHVYEEKIKDHVFVNRPACNLAILLKKGKISCIKGLDEILILPEIVSYVQTGFVGTEIKDIGNYGQIFVRFNIVCESWDRLREVLDFIDDVVSVLSEQGNEMVLSHFRGKYIASY